MDNDHHGDNVGTWCIETGSGCTFTSDPCSVCKGTARGVL